MSTKLQEEEGFTATTKYEIMKVANEELAALFEERMKEKIKERVKAANVNERGTLLSGNKNLLSQ